MPYAIRVMSASPGKQDEEPEDKNGKRAVEGGHRSRVGEKRRREMRTRLLQSALHVFVSGATGAVIEEVIREAGVSRGTFYNYFRTPGELYDALSEEASNQVLRLVDPVVLLHDDAAARVSCGVRLVLRTGHQHPEFGAFIARRGPGGVFAGGLFEEYLPRDLSLGMANGRFEEIPMRVAVDLVLGPVLAALHTLTTETVPPEYPDLVARGILKALGVPKVAAANIASAALPAVSADAPPFFRD